MYGFPSDFALKLDLELKTQSLQDASWALCSQEKANCGRLDSSSATGRWYYWIDLDCFGKQKY